MVEQHHIAERRHRASGSQHQIVCVERVGAAGLRRGYARKVAACGGAVRDVGVGNLRDVCQHRIGVDWQRVAKRHSQGVSAEVMNLLGKCFNKGMELVKRRHDALILSVKFSVKKPLIS